MTRQERTMLVSWLENEAYNGEGIVREMEKISIPEAVVKKYKTQNAACRIVAMMLKGIEEETISS